MLKILNNHIFFFPLKVLMALSFLIKKGCLRRMVPMSIADPLGVVYVPELPEN